MAAAVAPTLHPRPRLHRSAAGQQILEVLQLPRRQAAAGGTHGTHGAADFCLDGSSMDAQLLGVVRTAHCVQQRLHGIQ